MWGFRVGAFSALDGGLKRGMRCVELTWPGRRVRGAEKGVVGALGAACDAVETVDLLLAAVGQFEQIEPLCVGKLAQLVRNNAARLSKRRRRVMGEYGGRAAGGAVATVLKSRPQGRVP